MHNTFKEDIKQTKYELQVLKHEPHEVVIHPKDQFHPEFDIQLDDIKYEVKAQNLDILEAEYPSDLQGCIYIEFQQINLKKDTIYRDSGIRLSEADYYMIFGHTKDDKYKFWKIPTNHIIDEINKIENHTNLIKDLKVKINQIGYGGRYKSEVIKIAGMGNRYIKGIAKQRNGDNVGLNYLIDVEFIKKYNYCDNKMYKII